MRSERSVGAYVEQVARELYVPPRKAAAWGVKRGYMQIGSVNYKNYHERLSEPYRTTDAQKAIALAISYVKRVGHAR